MLTEPPGLKKNTRRPRLGATGREACLTFVPAEEELCQGRGYPWGARGPESFTREVSTTDLGLTRHSR